MPGVSQTAGPGTTVGPPPRVGNGPFGSTAGLDPASTLGPHRRDGMESKLKVCIEPWDDPAFRAAFETAYEAIRVEELPLDSPETARRAQHLLIEAGYPGARIELEKTVDEALAHVAHWFVHRGAPVAVAGR